MDENLDVWINRDNYTKKTDDDGIAKVSISLANLKEIYKMLILPKENFKIEIFRFRRYEATDHIDDLKLCENYLNFCVEFEHKFAPAILIRIHYRNKCIDTIKITGNDYDDNAKNFIDFLLKKITQSVSNFFN
ncbi:MAG: hypothetical protein EU529_15510 [Promethearchaeota archaeon]|nr:MAG: hypothetical protein EU529_15510 [Candidatus Lokiarchaeota archaeon]